MTYTVAIVVSPEFGEALQPIASRCHVWLALTPSNRTLADAYRRTNPEYSLEHGVTAFTIAPDATPEGQVLGVLGEVDLHHGQYSHTPPWDTLEIYGASPSPALRAALAEFGVVAFRETPDGFSCTRALNGAA